MNLAYEGFCPSCHNRWLFCDCVATFGDIGEDLAKDEPEEQEDDIDFIEDIDSPPKDDNDDYVDPDNKFPWGASAPGTLLGKRPYEPDQPTSTGKRPKPNPTSSGKRPSDSSGGGGKRPRPSRDDINIVNNIKDHLTDIVGDIDSPPKDDYDHLIYPDSIIVSDPTVQYYVPHDDVIDQIDNILSGFADDLNDYTNQGPDVVVPDNIYSLHRKYQHSGTPEYMRASPRSEVLNDANIPEFSGSMYWLPPNTLTPEEKNSTDFLTDDYVNFLKNDLTEWAENLNDLEAQRNWASECLITDPKYGFQERTPVSQNGRTVTKKGDIYYVDFPGGASTSFKTDMRLSKDFLFNTPESVLYDMTYENQNGHFQFKVEYDHGAPAIIGQNLQGDKSPTRFLNVTRVGIPSTLLSDGSGTYDRDENDYTRLPILNQPPPLEPLINNVINTRRLTGTGSINDPFTCFYENYNLLKFINCGQTIASTNFLVGLSTTKDNVGDPLNEISWGSGVGNKAPLICCHEMINEFNNVPTYGYCSLTLQCPVNISISLDVYSIDNGTKIYHDVFTKTGINPLVTIREQGTGPFVISLVGGTPLTVIARVKCDVGQTTYDHDRGGDAAVYWFPTSRFGDLPNRVVLKSASLLVRTTTDFVSYETTKNVSVTAGEPVGFGSLIVPDYPGLDLADLDRFAKLVVFINTPAEAFFLKRNGSVVVTQPPIMLTGTGVPGVIIPFTGATGQSTSTDFFTPISGVDNYTIVQGGGTPQSQAKERQILTMKYGSSW